MQREIEAKGLPTVLVTVVPNESKVMRPPRAIVPLGHTLGRILGHAGQTETQLKVVREALSELERLRLPGELVDFTP